MKEKHPPSEIDVWLQVETALFIDTDDDKVDDTGEPEHVVAAEHRQNSDVDEELVTINRRGPSCCSQRRSIDSHGSPTQANQCLSIS